MAAGVLSFQTAKDLLEKFRREMARLDSDPYDGDAALNACRDGYHLADWIWHGKLEHDQAAQIAIGGCPMKDRREFKQWVASQFPQFDLIWELCNGSKHFTPTRKDTVEHSYQSGWDRQKWGEGIWDAPPGFMVVVNGQHLGVNDMLKNLLTFWDNLFAKQGWP